MQTYGVCGTDSIESASKVDPYRLWARLASPQFEARLGLQKISFGSATLLRPLRWFDSLDPRAPLALTNGVYGMLERYVPLKETLYAKSGKLLKKTELGEFKRVDDRWFPWRMVFKDVLKKGKGTELLIESIEFDVPIPKHLFSKAALRR